MKIDKVLKQLGFINVTSELGLDAVEIRAYYKELSIDSDNSEYKLSQGCIIYPDFHVIEVCEGSGLTWFEGRGIDNQIDAGYDINFDQVFQRLTSEQKKIAIYNLDILKSGSF